MEQRNINWLLYLRNFIDDDLYEAEYEKRDFCFYSTKNSTRA